MTQEKIIRYLFKTNWIKTIWFNFRYLPFRQALYLPFFISRHTRIVCERDARIILEQVEGVGTLKPCMLKLGYANVPTQCVKSDPLSLYLKKNSNLIFKGWGRISAGTQIYLMDGASVIIGEGCYLSMDVKIYAQKSIIIGNNTAVGWGSQIVDSDFHDIINKVTGQVYPQCKEVIIGNHCWICNSCSISKGTIIPDEVIVGARSLCNKEYDVPVYSVIAGSPAKFIKEGITFEH